MDSPFQLMVCVFDGAARADEVYRDLRSLDRRLDEIKLGNIAVVRKLADGQVAISETYDPKFNTSLVGSLPLVGMLVGLIAQRVGILGLSRVASVALGGAAGLLAGVAISTLNLGFPDETLQQLGEGLAADQLAIVMLVRPSEKRYVRAKLVDLGGTLIQDTLPPEMIAQLTAPKQTGPIGRQTAQPVG
jgi:uncharacterized membrane protein